MENLEEHPATHQPSSSSHETVPPLARRGKGRLDPISQKCPHDTMDGGGDALHENTVPKELGGGLGHKVPQPRIRTGKALSRCDDMAEPWGDASAATTLKSNKLWSLIHPARPYTDGSPRLAFVAAPSPRRVTTRCAPCAPSS